MVTGMVNGDEHVPGNDDWEEWMGTVMGNDDCEGGERMVSVVVVRKYWLCEELFIVKGVGEWWRWGVGELSLGERGGSGSRDEKWW